MTEAYEELTACLEDDKIQKWSQDEKQAMMWRGEHLEIYDVRMESGRAYNYCQNSRQC